MNQDLEHLRLLSIFHYVVAGIAALFSLFPILHLLIGLGLATGRFEEADPLARQMGWFFTVFAGAWIVFGLTFTVLLVIAGANLARRQHYLFCLVIAGLACMFMPFGTVLGVFTILVLMRESVKELFGVSNHTAIPGEAP